MGLASFFFIYFNPIIRTTIPDTTRKFSNKFGISTVLQYLCS